MVEVTNGQYADDDRGPIGDAARGIASYCDGPERANVYRRAKVELAAAIAEGRRQMREEAAREIERYSESPHVLSVAGRVVAAIRAIPIGDE